MYIVALTNSLYIIFDDAEVQVYKDKTHQMNKN